MTTTYSVRLKKVLKARGDNTPSEIRTLYNSAENALNAVYSVMRKQGLIEVSGVDGSPWLPSWVLYNLKGEKGGFKMVFMDSITDNKRQVMVVIQKKKIHSNDTTPLEQ